ncbi:hypothetical protein VP01_2719g4 [Puccinia sorghi]|uniref:Uncharacterized protein n=1 Tax=Puccinia sorghi TaxID=27349 RepID=A0A0L6V3G3_9BASI|nr:hypothetical protein VP01_2719g4 [Puccinia sorghi]
MEITDRFRVIHHLIIINTVKLHPIGRSSQDLDRNSTPVNARLLWDTALSKLSITDTSIDVEIQKDLMKELRSRTANLLMFKHLQLLDEGFAHLRDHLPVRIFKFSMNPLLYQIRVELAPEFVKQGVNPNSLTSNDKRKIMKQVTKLISWLLHINISVLRNLQTTGIMSSNRKLVDWIFKNIFEPQNSLPVIGRFSGQDIQAFTKGKEFGPIQQILITLLSSSLSSSREPQTAVMIISHYYENECPEVSRALKSGQLPDLRSLTIQSTRSNSRIGRGLDEGSSWIQELGNFPVRSLEQLPESLKPKVCNQDPLKGRIGMKLRPRKQELSGHIMEIFSQRKCYMSQSFSFKFHDSKFPVMIVRKNESDQGRKYGWVWLCNTNNQMPLPKITVLRRLKRFMTHLNMCDAALLIHMKNIKLQIGFEFHPLLINWIHEVLFDVNQNKLPLLGDFILEGRTSINSFSPSDFNVIQIFLIHLITSKNPHMRNFQVALSVFGYWLKNMSGMIYGQLFKNDQEYWDIMTKIIDPDLED